jgi:hypothetical protein
MAKDGEGAPWLQPCLERHLYEVADAVIKAAAPPHEFRIATGKTA